VLNTQKPALLITVALVLVVGVAPLLAMFTASVTIDGKVSLLHYQTLVSSRRAWALLAQSLTLSFLTVSCAMLLGVPLGVLLSRTDLPLKRVLAVLFTLPLLLPPYLIAVAWVSVLGREGWLSRILGGTLTEVGSHWLFNLPGCVLVLTTVFMPVAMLLMIAHLQTVDSRRAYLLVGGGHHVWEEAIESLVNPR
jgi:iron(III) transport system permease protein